MGMTEKEMVPHLDAATMVKVHAAVSEVGDVVLVTSAD
jgi:hypothetical protein